jgi:hypothetical protein
MKNIKYIVLLLVLCVGGYCYAVIDTFEGQEITTSANIESVTTTDTIEGQEITAGGAPSGAPAWGTYGTAVGNILFAWDGKSSSGVAVAYLSDESEIGGVNTGGTFSTDGARTIWITDADDDRLVWSIDSGDIDQNDAEGLTIFIEFKSAAITGNKFIFDFVGDVNDYWRLKLTTTPQSASNYDGDGNYDGSATQGMVADGSTYNTVGVSIKVGSGGDDHAIGLGWNAQADSLVAWADAESAIMLGDLLAASSSDVVSISKFVVIRGWEQAKPW